MAKIPQYYGMPGVPLEIDADPGDPVRAWSGQRARLRGWVDGLAGDDWNGRTRCPDWNTRQLVQHLASGAAFLGWTMHQAAKGVPSELLRDFDTHATVEGATNLLDELTIDELKAELAKADANIEREAGVLGADGWVAIAEAPPGHLRAHLALSHFMFDSWVHEHDLLLPRGEEPMLVALEAEVSARYVLGLAGAVTGLDMRLDVRLTDVDRRVGVDGDGTRVRVASGGAPAGAPVVEGRAADVLDRVTGRGSDALEGDKAGLDALDRFATLLA